MASGKIGYFTAPPAFPPWYFAKIISGIKSLNQDADIGIPYFHIAIHTKDGYHDVKSTTNPNDLVHILSISTLGLSISGRYSKRLDSDDSQLSFIIDGKENHIMLYIESKILNLEHDIYEYFVKSFDLIPYIEKFEGRFKNPAFDVFKLFHHKVHKFALDLYINRHYRQAILDTYIGIIGEVQQKSGRPDLDGVPLMQHVFSSKNPLLRLSANDVEQQAFQMLFNGAAGAIRNPNAHRVSDQPTEAEALEWLGFASALFRLLDTAQVVPQTP
jgi:uncharacterized protein (TIGR02391 family)